MKRFALLFCAALGLVLSCGTANAGHGLTYRNIEPIASLGAFAEFNIGHSIVARAMFVGLRAAVAEMKRRLDDALLRAAALPDEDHERH